MKKINHLSIVLKKNGTPKRPVVGSLVRSKKCPDAKSHKRCGDKNRPQWREKLTKKLSLYFKRSTGTIVYGLLHSFLLIRRRAWSQGNRGNRRQTRRHRTQEPRRGSPSMRATYTLSRVDQTQRILPLALSEATLDFLLFSRSSPSILS